MRRHDDAAGRAGEPDWYAAGHWRGETLWDSLVAAARQAPGATVDDGREAVSLSALHERACRIAGGLSAAGVGAGSAVIVQSRNSVDACAALLACFAGGFVAIPLPPMFSAAQVAAVAASAKAEALILLEEEDGQRPADVLAAAPALKAAFVAGPAGAGSDKRLRAWGDCLGANPLAPAPPHPDADHMVLYSSGSTGSPKGVVHSGNTLRFAVEALARFHQVGRTDRILVALEFGFVGGTVLGVLLGFLAGASTVLMRRWDAGECLAAIERHAITYTLLMPTHCFDVLRHPDLDRRDTGSLSRAIMAGATPEQRRAATGRFCGIPLPMYGMSESIGHCTCALDDAQESRNTTDGRPLPGTDMQVLDEDGNQVPAGAIGNVFLRGPNRLRRYQARPDLTAETIVAGGWFRTGDRARYSEGGFMTFIARAGETIRRGGVMIQPGEVEAALRDHPSVAEIAVVAVPDRRLGERACACAVLIAGQRLDLESIRQHLAAAGLPRYQWPEFLLILDEFPRTPSLKVRRADLAALARQRLRDAIEPGG
ncbi:MAG: cyclohexanecarboxylate-CoA ligase [Alphaproteobacteria bacterium]|nr:MAG: cyclohexanecarboxylate-CoA ligase [Alphaproteobacteria bacterium]